MFAFMSMLLLAYYIGQGEIANTLLQGWNEMKVDK